MRLLRSFWQRPRRLILIAALIVPVASICGLYASTSGKISAARAARRSDRCAKAESDLDGCWALPGLHGAIELEWALLGVQQGDLTSEAAWQRRVERRQPESLLILEALAEGNLATFRFNEGRNYADALLARQPDHARGLWLRGRAWSKVQQEDKALDDLQLAVEHEPESPEIRLTLAELLHKQGHVRQAEAHYEALLRQCPDDLRVVVGLAHCRQEDGQFIAAAELLDALLAKRPRSVAALVERGRVALRTGRPDDGERLVRQAVEECPDHPDANFVLTLCLRAQGKSDEELPRRVEEAERVQAALRPKLRATPRDPAVLCDVGRWMLRSGQEQEAAGWFFLALIEDPHYAPAHAALAEYFHGANQPRRAEAHRRRAGSVAGNQAARMNVRAEPVDLAKSPIGSLVLGSPPSEATAEEVHKFCGACHVYPPPDSMPRATWRKEVKQGFDLWHDSTMQGEVPPLESVVLYYENRAPQHLPPAEQPKAEADAAGNFQRKGAGWLTGVPPFPGVARLTLASLSDPTKLDLLACDTRIDRVMRVKPYEPSSRWELLGEVIVPCRAMVVDLDGDGQKDVVVASLGQFFPTDDKVGSVVWLRGSAGGRFEPLTLLEGVGRVADVQAADFNADGLLDLVVAVFGWRRTGEIIWLENRTTDWTKPKFVPYRVDERHGTIDVPVIDLNGDGRPDFVALISQEHETVVAFLNRGKGEFQKETLFTGPHPSYGSSGIQLVDLDGDGDDDVLMTNGDVLDRPYLLKPYHGVQWLENEGRFPFTHHRIAPLYGASQAVAADFDGDHDLDVVAVSFLPRLEFPERERLGLPSVLLLEQTAPRQFRPHVLEAAACDHFSCAAGDWNADGRADVAIGNFSWKRSQPIADAAVLYSSRGTHQGTR